jgi:hypothetical protein
MFTVKHYFYLLTQNYILLQHHISLKVNIILIIIVKLNKLGQGAKWGKID